MFDRKSKKVTAPTYEEQSQMKQEILYQLNEIIDEWQPQFIIQKNRDTILKANELLQMLENAREKVKNTSFSRAKPALSIFYKEINNSIDKIKENMRCANGEGELREAVTTLCNAVDKLANIKKSSENHFDAKPTDEKFTENNVMTILDKNQYSVVEIEKGNDSETKPYTSVGTGFVISNNGYILTNHHVVVYKNTNIVVDKKNNKYCESLFMKNVSGRTSIEVICSDEKYDIAICKFDTKSMSGLTAVKRIENYADLKQGEGIVLVGNPQAKGIRAIPGTVSYTKDGKGDLVLSALVIEGDSGAPVFNKCGECVGIHKGKDKNAIGMAYAIPMDTIEEFLKDWCKENHIVLESNTINPKQLSSNLNNGRKEIELNDVGMRQSEICTKTNDSKWIRRGIDCYNKHKYSKAVNFLEKAIDNGCTNSDAHYYLGLCHYYGRGTYKNYKEAVKLFKISAQDPNCNYLSEARYHLGCCYYYGLPAGGVYDMDKNYVEAVSWFELLICDNDFKLLSDAQYYIPAFDEESKAPIPEFEWIIRGKNIGLREVKTRLNLSISTYQNLCSKFEPEYISLKKCIATAYITREFEKDYKNIRSIGFDKIIDLYIQNPNIDTIDVIAEISNEVKNGRKTEDEISISSDFIEDLKTLISNNMIASDYKQYFYNFPKDSYLNTDKENQLINILLYDKSVSTEELDRLVEAVFFIRKDSVLHTFQRLERLNKLFPKCIFSNIQLFSEAVTYNSALLYKTLEEKFSYDTESISYTTKIITNPIDIGIEDKQYYIDMLCDIAIDTMEPKAQIIFRRFLIEKYNKDILAFKILFTGERPLITKAEIDILENPLLLNTLVDFTSKELNGDVFNLIHTAVTSKLELKNKDVFLKVVDLYCKLYDVLGTTNNDVFTKNIFELTSLSRILDGNLEKIIIDNNDLSTIKEKYIDIINLLANDGTISVNTIDILNQLGLCDGLRPEYCLKLNEAGYFKSFIANAATINMSLIDFEDKNIIQTINDTNFFSKDDIYITTTIFCKIRAYILKTNYNLAIEQYGKMFLLPHSIITEDELSHVSYSLEVLPLIDITQINETNVVYLAKFLSATRRNTNETYQIMEYISQISDVNVKRDFFLALNFETLSYHIMSSKRKNNVIAWMKDSFDFSSISDQIIFMQTTRCTHSPFEQIIKKSIAEKTFTAYNELYVEYLKKARKITDEMIDNLTSIDKIYAMPDNILEKLYASGKYQYYVASKTLYRDEFIFEKKKLETLRSAYKNIFLSKPTGFIKTKSKMSENWDFVTYMMEKEFYVGTEEQTRFLFANCYQTEKSLVDLFENYSSSFIIKYLSTIKGFKDRQAAIRFLEQIKNNTVVSASNGVYENNYNALVDSTFKRNFTKWHNNASEK